MTVGFGGGRLEQLSLVAGSEAVIAADGTTQSDTPSPRRV